MSNSRVRQPHPIFWLSLLCSLLLISGCQPDELEHDLVFEAAEHYDVSNAGETLELAWTFTPDEKIMNPVVVDAERAIYFQTREAVYAVDPDDGSLIWRHPVDDPTLDSIKVFIVPYENMLLIPTERERVLQGVDAKSGQVQWELPFYNHVSAHSGRPQMADLVVDDERAYALISLNRGTAVLAIDPNTGDVLWEAPDDLAGGLPGAIFQDSEKDYLNVYSRWIWKLDKATGAIIDQFDINMSSTRRPTYADGVAYTSGSTVRAIDLETPEEIWSFQPTDCEKESRRTVFTPPILYDDVGYLLTACEVMYAADIESGETRWQTDILPSPMSMTQIGDQLFVLGLDAQVNAVDAVSGEVHSALTLSPPEINAVTYHHLVSTDELLILTPGNTQAFAFRVKQ